MGHSVTVLEQFEFGNQNGSSAEHVRMWRTAITELNHAKMALDSGKMYQELENDTNKQILYKKGLLNFGVETDYTEQGTIETAHEVLKELGHPGIRYTKKQIEKRFPFKNLPDNYYGFYHENNAVIDVKVLIQSMLDLNKKFGVSLKSHEKVIDIKNEANGVIVTTEKDIYYAKKMIIASGPYSNEITRHFGFELNFTFWNMPMAYYKVTDNSLEFPMWFQFDFPDETSPSKLFYGFPPVHFARQGFVRLAIDWASHKFTDINERRYIPEVVDIEMTRQYIAKYLRGVSTMPIDMTTAVQGQLPDNLSVLDYMPDKFVKNNKNIILCAGGWAFKFVPLFGKICAQLAINGETEYSISDLSILRKNIIKQEL